MTVCNDPQCNREGEVRPPLKNPLCFYHWERAYAFAERNGFLGEVEVDPQIASMRAHPAGWRAAMRRKWYGDDPYAIDTDYNRGDK